MTDARGEGEAGSDGCVVAVPGGREREELLEALALAFLGNPMNLVIHGSNPAARLRANRAGLRALVLRESRRVEARVALIDERVVGGFIAVRPGEFPYLNVNLRDQIGCLFHQGYRAMKSWSLVNQELVGIHPLEPHWYLAVLGVAPRAWRRGVGRALVDELGRLVDREPAPIYLESDRAESVSFYHRLGFETRAQTRILGVDCFSLERLPGLPGF